jgi:drug/metabolite transporter (DMT)-like permease
MVAAFWLGQEGVLELSSTLVAGLSGICFSFVGIGFRLASERKIHVLHALAVLSAVGVVVFGVRAVHAGQISSGRVAGIGAVAGVTQYLAVYGVNVALKRGPLTAVWCALMLNFIPVLVYAAAVLGEPISFWHSTASIAGIACVAMGATLVSAPKEGECGIPSVAHRIGHSMVFGLILFGILLLNGVFGVTVKHVATVNGADGIPLMESSGDIFRALVYLTILILIGMDQAINRRPISAPAHILGFGLLSGAGSVGGLWLLCLCASAPAGSVFVVMTVTSLVFASLVGALFFGEPRTWRWYATLGLGILAALLSKGDAILRMFRES